MEIYTLVKAGIKNRKGIMIGFKNDTFKAPEKLMELVFSSFGAIKVRPDQRLFIEKDLSSYDERINTIKQYVLKILNLIA